MSAPIGQRMQDACATVERLGGCSAAQVSEILGFEASTHLHRAVGHGLLSVQRACRPHQYHAIPGWREAAQGRPARLLGMAELAVMANRAAFPLSNVWGGA